MKLARLAAVLCFSVLFAAPASARIEVTLDAESLNGILASMAPDTVEVGLAAGKSVVIRLKDLKVTGFDPAAGVNGGVTTSVRLIVDELGIDVPVEPHLTLEISDISGGRKGASLRFDKVLLKLPLTGAIDVAALLPPLALMPDAAWVLNSARGRVRVKPNLLDAKTGAKNIRLGFALEVTPADGK